MTIAWKRTKMKILKVQLVNDMTYFCGIIQPNCFLIKEKQAVQQAVQQVSEENVLINRMWGQNYKPLISLKRLSLKLLITSQ